MAYDLIIFDCDGTLVDTEYMNIQAISDILAEQGLSQYSAEVVLARFSAQTLTSIFEQISEETGVSLPDDMIARQIRRVKELASGYMKVVDHAPELVAWASSKGPICLASNGEPENVMFSIQQTGMKKFFPDDRIFVSAMVEKGKPAPDLFLLAAQKIGAAPSRTLVIEDSVPGVTAGKAAGMTVLGFVGTSHDQVAQCEKLKEVGADKIYSTMAEIQADLAVDFIPERAGLAG